MRNLQARPQPLRSQPWAPKPQSPVARSLAAPGRPGLSALHVARTIVLPPAAMRALAEADCQVHRRHCGETPAEMEILDAKYRLGETFGYDYAMDPEDLAEIEKNIRAARENADFVIVSIHSHECSLGCDDPSQPRGAGNFLKQFAHESIDSGAAAGKLEKLVRFSSAI